MTVSQELKPSESMCVGWWPEQPKMTTAVMGGDDGGSCCLCVPSRASCQLVFTPDLAFLFLSFLSSSFHFEGAYSLAMTSVRSFVIS